MSVIQRRMSVSDCGRCIHPRGTDRIFRGDCFAPQFIKEINLKKITLAPTHYFGKDGKERIVDLVFRCPLKNGGGNLMAVIVFEHQSGSLKKIPQKLLKYIRACLHYP